METREMAAGRGERRSSRRLYQVDFQLREDGHACNCDAAASIAPLTCELRAAARPRRSGPCMAKTLISLSRHRSSSRRVAQWMHGPVDVRVQDSRAAWTEGEEHAAVPACDTSLASGLTSILSHSPSETRPSVVRRVLTWDYLGSSGGRCFQQTQNSHKSRGQAYCKQSQQLRSGDIK